MPMPDYVPSTYKTFQFQTETWAHLTEIPGENSRGRQFLQNSQLCCVNGNIYLVGGVDDRKVTEYNPLTNTWRNMPSLQLARSCPILCTLDKKIFALGGVYDGDGTCEMLDLSDDDPQWRYIASMNSRHYGGGAAVIEKKIYVVGGYYNDNDTNADEVYDVDQGKYHGLLHGKYIEYLQII